MIYEDNLDANGIVGSTFNQQESDPYAPKKQKIDALYQELFKRNAGEEGYNAWLGNDNFEAEIRNSPEAQTNARKAGVAGAWNEDTFWKGWQGQNANDLTSYIQQNGYSPYVTQFGSKNDKLRINNTGTEWDAVIAQGLGGRGRQQLQVGGPGFAQPSNGGYPPESQPRTPGFPPESQPRVPGGFPPESQPRVPGGFPPESQPRVPGGQQSLFDILMGRATQGLNVDRNDPVIRAQSDAYSANEQRARRDFLDTQAERGNPYGTGAMLGQERMSAEGVGQRTGAFEAEAMGRELAAKRYEIQSALDGARGMLTAQQQMDLQRELALMDDALKRHQIETQNSQFGASLAQQGNQFNANLGQQESQFARTQGQQQGQFNSTLGFNTDDRRSYWDAIRRGLI